jgi:hypothetical protein
MESQVQGLKDRSRRHRGKKAEAKGSRLISPYAFSFFACGFRLRFQAFRLCF